MRRRLRYAIVVAAALTPLFGLTGRSAEREGARPAAYSFELVEIPTPPLGGLKLPNSALEPLDWDALDRVGSQMITLQPSLLFCRAVVLCFRPCCRRARRGRCIPPLTQVCHQALADGQLSEEQARTFFEHNFRPSAHNQVG